MKSFEIDFEGKMTPVYFAEDVDKVTTELREMYEKSVEDLKSKLRENQGVMEHVSCQPPRTLHDDISNVLRTCEREGNAAPAYDFLRGMGAGWWLCDKLNSPPEQRFEERMREVMEKSMNRREEK